MITIDQMIQREVNCCLSSLVMALAHADGAVQFNTRMHSDSSVLADLIEQATELASPVFDYEEAARQASWEPYTDSFGVSCWRNDAAGIEPLTWAGDAQSLCEAHGIDPYEWEVYEHWSVSAWLAEKLIKQGEKVDTDFAAMNVWARTTTGQGIANDTCIQKIYAAMVAP